MRLLSLIYPLFIAPLSAAYIADFNTPGQLAADFSSSQAGPVTQSTTGGLNNGGAVNLSGLGTNTEQIFTLNQSFDGSLGSWSASLFYRGNAQNFYGFGIVGEAAPDIFEGVPSRGQTFLSNMYLQSGSAEDGAFGVGNYSAAAGVGDFSPLAVIPGGLPTADAWYKYSMNVTHSGSSNYSVQATLSAADANGATGATLATVTYNFSNPELSADPSVYLFFYMYDGQAIDNFSTTAVPETSVALVAATSFLAGAFRRRRSLR